MKEYNQRPKTKRKRAKYMREYNQRPEVKARNQRPHIKLQRTKYLQNYYKTDRYKKRVMEQYTPETKRRINLHKTERRKKDMDYRIRCILRSRLRKVLKGKLKSAKTKELLGCSITYFLDYMESQFDDEMSWANYGQWHLDHIKPCASFNLINPEEQRECFHYTNLQPLWAEDNLRKGAKVVLSL